MKPQENSIFLNGINCKDVNAYRLLYQRYYKPLVLFAMRFIDEQQVAEDVVEDVVVSIWENDHAFDSLISFEGYVYNAVRNRAINVLRHSDVHQKYENEMKLGEIGAAYDADEEKSFEEQYIQLFEAMDNLPKRCQEVMNLYIEGLTNAEIANRLQLSVETVKTHRKRALAMLREQLRNVVFLLFYLHFFNL